MKKLFFLIGPTAVGATRIIEQFVLHYPEIFSRIRTWTTRPPRDLSDHFYYHYVYPDEFAERKEKGEFFETDFYAGHWKGSMLTDFTDVLQTHYAIMKITLPGARAILDRTDIPARVIFLHHIPRNLLLDNYISRLGRLLTPEEKIRFMKEAEEYMKKAEEVLPFRACDAKIYLDKTVADSESLKNYFRAEGVEFPEEYKNLSAQ